MTVTINHAVEAIKTAETTEAIIEILLNCGKVKSMVEVYEEASTESYSGRVIGISKEEIANNMAHIIITRRENTKFKCLTVEEKFAEITATDCYQLPRKLHCCTVDELKTIAEMLGIDTKEITGEKEYQTRYNCEMNIMISMKNRENSHEEHETEISQTLKAVKIRTLDELYTALEGKTDRTEITAILNGATVEMLKSQLPYKGYEEGTSKWKKADYVEAVADQILDEIYFEEERAKILANMAKQETAEQEETTEEETTMTMTHDEIVKELREIGRYLQEKGKNIKARYGEKPEFANEMDEWHYKILMQVCGTIEERECINPYIKVEIPDLNYARTGYGIEIKSATETAETETAEWTDDDFHAFFPDGEIHDADLCEMYLDEIDALNRYIARKDAEMWTELNGIREAMKYPLVVVPPSNEPSEDMTLHRIEFDDDYTVMWDKLDKNFEMVDRCECKEEIRYLLYTGNPHTLYLMLKARGYEMPIGEWSSAHGKLITAFVWQEFCRRKKLSDYKELNAAYAEQREFVRIIGAERRKWIKIVSEHKGNYPNVERGIIVISEEYRKARIESFRLYLRIKKARIFLKL